MKRKKGCLACHTKHNTKGKCQLNKISNNKCLSCHNKEFVGTDYLGLFPKDFHHSFRAPLTKDGKYPSVKYGIDHHHLNEDIHHTIGMNCVSCHNNNNGTSWETGAKCTNCHTNLTPKNHQDYHKNISCSACHSSWNISSYELSVFRDDTANYQQWKNLTLQEDGYLTNFLTKALKSKKTIQPMMPDWVDKKMKKGIWYSGYRYRRWENFILGNSEDGKIKILRPLFQYRISYKDKNQNMIFDDINTINGKKIEAWIPYSPHTISKKAKSCEMCHNNQLILNQTKSNNEILDLSKPQNIIKGSLLNQSQLKKLQSQKYKKIRAKLLLYY
jgi:predicted CXXCH cytochrome family protein